MNARLQAPQHDYAGEAAELAALAEREAYERFCHARSDADLMESFADYVSRTPESFAAYEAWDRARWLGVRS